MKKQVTIVSRKSTLALWQAEFVQQALQFLHPYLKVKIMGVTTEGDQILNTPLFKFGGKGLFVKALEEHLLNGTADIAVHSLKDMPIELPEGLELSVILEREDPRDAFISQHFPNLHSLPFGATVGTSSLRRQSQLLALRPDLRLISLRGNIDTRIEKLDRGEYDAIILAVAGVKRLGLENRILELFDPERLLPAIGQGALTIECRVNDAEIKRLIAPLHHFPTAQCVLAERTMSAFLGGGCQLPIAGLAQINADGILILEGIVASPKGKPLLKAKASGKPEATIELGTSVAKQLIDKGAMDIINACQQEI